MRNLPAVIESKAINYSALHRYCLQRSLKAEQFVRSRMIGSVIAATVLRRVDQTCACHFEERLARMNGGSRPSGRML
jgi:hypothetical protein